MIKTRVYAQQKESSVYLKDSISCPFVALQVLKRYLVMVMEHFECHVAVFKLSQIIDFFLMYLCPDETPCRQKRYGAWCTMVLKYDTIQNSTQKKCVFYNKLELI